MNSVTKYRYATALLTLICSSGLQGLARAQIILTGNQTFTANPGFSGSAIAYDNSTLTVLGGTFSQIVNRDFSHTSFNGGTVNVITSAERSTVSITGGSIFTGYVAVDESSTIISGGNIAFFAADTSMSALINGGTIPDIQNFKTSTVIQGGNLNRIYSLGDGFINLFGTNFSLSVGTPGVVSAGGSNFSGFYYTLTGRFLNNGTSGTYSLFDATDRTVVSSGITTPVSGGFVFNAPEPASLALLALLSPLGFIVLRRNTIRKITVEAS